MRIAFVNDYSLDHIGGAVTSMFEQKKALEQAGHAVFIFQLGKPTATPHDGVIFIPPSFTLPKSAYHLPILLNRRKHTDLLRKLLTEHEIDVIHFQSEMTLAYAISKIAAEMKLPMFFTIHTLFWKYTGPLPKFIAGVLRLGSASILRQKVNDFHPTGNAVEKALKNITLEIASRTDTVFSPSLHQKKVIEATQIKTPVIVSPNPFTPYAQPASTISTSPHPLKFVWAGRCVPEKRPLEFLEAIKLTSKKTIEPFTVDIIGDGPLLEQIKKDNALPNVTFHGQLSHDKTIELFDQSDVVCLSSYGFDNQPMIIAEAISRFRPVLYCDKQLTEGVDTAGYLTKNETPKAIATAMQYLIEHPSEVGALSRRAQEAATIFTPQAYAKRTVAHYRQSDTPLVQ